jgi:hypothetical protein
MGRRKLDQNLEKYTLLLPRELNLLIERVIAQTGESKPHFLRNLIQAFVLELVNEPSPTGKRRITLELNQETALLLQRTAAAKGIRQQDMAQLILTESVSAYYSRGLQEAADRAAALEQSQPESARKNA